MCIIASKERGVDLPRDEYMLECAKTNRDGVGIMYVKDGKNEVLVKKDFIDTEAFIRWMHLNIAKEDVAVIHFRYATHGLKDVGNRHPFPVTKNKVLLRQAELVCQVACVHNGVLTEHGTSTKYSDTQKFVLDILAEDSIKNNIDSEVIRTLIANYIGSDKLVILNDKGTLYYFGDFNEHEGIKYSNNGWRPTFYSSIGYGVRSLMNRDDGYGGYGFTPKDTKETIISNDTSVPYHGQCDGCYEVKNVMYVEIEDNAFSLCKSCRKKYRKGTLPGFTKEELEYLKEETEADGNTEVVEIPKTIECKSCSNYFPEHEIVSYYGTEICEECMQQAEADITGTSFKESVN